MDSAPETITLETLLPEIKLHILRAAPDIKTLQSLIEASPDYHAVYSQNREDIFTCVTLRQLNYRGINILQPMHWARIFLRDPIGDSHCLLLQSLIQTAIQYFQQHRQLKLPVDDCLALLTMMGLEPWLIERTRVQWPNGVCAVHRPLGPVCEYAKLPEHSWLEYGNYSTVTLIVTGWPIPPLLPRGWATVPFFKVNCPKQGYNARAKMYY